MYGIQRQNDMFGMVSSGIKIENELSANFDAALHSGLCNICYYSVVIATEKP